MAFLVFPILHYPNHLFRWYREWWHPQNRRKHGQAWAGRRRALGLGYPIQFHLHMNLIFLLVLWTSTWFKLRYLEDVSTGYIARGHCIARNDCRALTCGDYIAKSDRLSLVRGETIVLLKRCLARFEPHVSSGFFVFILFRPWPLHAYFKRVI